LSEAAGFFLLFFYICIAIGDPVIKRGGLEIQLSRGDDWDPVIKRG
jgi:hypothetical protein